MPSKVPLLAPTIIAVKKLAAFVNSASFVIGTSVAVPARSEAATTGGLAMNRQKHGVYLKVRPAIAMPIAAAFMLAEGDAWTRPPIVLVNDHAGRRWVDVALLHMPTCVAAAAAHDRRRGRYHRRGQDGRAGGCTEKYFGNRRHCRRSFVQQPTNDRAPSMFRRNIGRNFAVPTMERMAPLLSARRRKKTNDQIAHEKARRRSGIITRRTNGRTTPKPRRDSRPSVACRADMMWCACCERAPPRHAARPNPRASRHRARARRA